VLEYRPTCFAWKTANFSEYMINSGELIKFTRLKVNFSNRMAINNFTISPIDVSAREKLDIRAGDTVCVWQKFTEKVVEKDKIKEKTRTQAFDGLVLARKHGKESGGTFTVRKVVDGVGVEKIFPIYAPSIEKIEVLRRSKVRQAKIYHVREKAAKEIRREMRNIRAVRKDDSPVEEKAEEVEKE